MLRGARPDWERRLRAEGFAVRLDLPFGTDWWPHGVRRVGEHPRNALLLGRSLLSGNRAGAEVSAAG
jgi:proline dehydrogenase